jgi:hypothetical protein
MPAFDPWHACVPEDVGQSFFDIQEFPSLKRVQVLDEFRKEANAEAPHGTARLVPGLVLIEAPVRISRSLAHVQTPWLGTSRIV